MTWTEKKFAEVNGRRMAYVETGDLNGDPIVFLHGNPTSSYLWRDIIPHAKPFGRCIAPDLIGMGDSDKLSDSGPDRYTFVEHADYLFALLEQIGVTENVTLVIHDWGSGLGFHWANTHRDAVRGIAYMEAMVKPRSWADFPEKARPAFEAMRSPKGEEMVLENNFFVEVMLPGSIIRDLAAEEHDEYRRPFAEPGESRRPTLTWPRQIPIDGEPADVAQIMADYAEWLPESDVPKLFIDATPGAILSDGPSRDFCRTWKNQTEVQVAGVHFVQEDSPDEIGKALAGWLQTL
ncbi:MAG: haloalkane dehalogenase [Alphaproteobacteria bacterium]|nr:haloalkane dehalogenase [Alphaproteobacteria bacterium]